MAVADRVGWRGREGGKEGEGEEGEVPVVEWDGDWTTVAVNQEVPLVAADLHLQPRTTETWLDRQPTAVWTFLNAALHSVHLQLHKKYLSH